MTEETLIKYLVFLKLECLRHSNDKLVDESEVQLFKLEVDKFKSLFRNSQFDPIIKEKVNSLKFNLSIPLYKGINLMAYLIGNGWSNSNQREEAMSKIFRQFSEDIDCVILEIKASI